VTAPVTLTPLTFDELDSELADVLRPRVERLGYLGDFFGHMGRQPAAVAHFERFTLSLRAALPARLAETVAVTVATRLGNDYERHQHEHLAVRSGLDPAWVADVERCTPDDPGVRLEPAERCCQRYVLAAVDRLGQDCGPLLDAVTAATDATTATAVVLLTARFIAHAVVSRTCELEAPVPSIFEPALEDPDGADPESEHT
jgi:hypothetical protein